MPPPPKTKTSPRSIPGEAILPRFLPLAIVSFERAMSHHPGCPGLETTFGPVVPSTCRGGFDFTLLFEHIFFALLPAVVLLVAAAVRLWKLRHAQTVTSGALCLQLTKQVGFFLSNHDTFGSRG